MELRSFTDAEVFLMDLDWNIYKASNPMHTHVGISPVEINRTYTWVDLHRIALQSKCLQPTIISTLE